MGSVKFNCLYLLDPSGLEGTLFKNDWLTFFDPSIFLPGYIKKFEYYMGVDPNVSGDPGSDRLAIVLKPIQFAGAILKTIARSIGAMSLAPLKVSLRTPFRLGKDWKFHGGIMMVQAIVDETERANLAGDVPALFLVAFVLWYLMPRNTGNQ